MKKYIIAVMLFFTIAHANETVCIDHGDIIICTDDKGNYTTVIRD